MPKAESRSSAEIACERGKDMRGSELQEFADRLTAADEFVAARLQSLINVRLHHPVKIEIEEPLSGFTREGEDS